MIVSLSMVKKKNNNKYMFNCLLNTFTLTTTKFNRRHGSYGAR